MTLAFEEIFSIADAFQGIPMAGRTDAWILGDAAAAHGIPRDSPELARFPEVYFRHLATEIEISEKRGTTLSPRGRYGVMPGVRVLLDALVANPAAFLALLTGNYEAGARLKLEHFDLWRYFQCGAFGDAAPDRNGLMVKALERTAACGATFQASDAVVIGDTPLDIACARTGGARSIAVATGSHSVEELRAAGADVAFEDLSDTETVLAAILRF